MRKRAVTVFFAFAVFGLLLHACNPAPASARGGEYKGKRVSLDLSDIDIWNVLSLFAEEFGLNVVLEPGIIVRVTLHVENVPWDRVFDMILKKYGLVMKVDAPVIRIGRLSKEKKRGGGTDGFRRGRFSVADSKAPNAGYWYSGKPISLYLRDAEVSSAARLLAKAGEAEITVDPDVSGKVTLLVENVPWDHILDIIVEMNGLVKTAERDSIHIASSGKTEPGPIPESVKQAESPAGPDSEQSEFDKLAARKAPPGVLIEQLIKMYGKEQIITVIRKHRQNRITVLVDNGLKEVFGPPDERFVSARSIQEDLRKMNISVHEFKKILEGTHVRS